MSRRGPRPVRRGRCARHGSVRRSRRRRPARHRGPPARGRARPEEDPPRRAGGDARWAVASARVREASPGAGHHRSRWRILGGFAGAWECCHRSSDICVSARPEPCRAVICGTTRDYLTRQRAVSGVRPKCLLKRYLWSWSVMRAVRSRVSRVHAMSPSIGTSSVQTESRACRGASKGPSSGIRCQSAALPVPDRPYAPVSPVQDHLAAAGAAHLPQHAVDVRGEHHPRGRPEPPAREVHPAPHRTSVRWPEQRAAAGTPPVDGLPRQQVTR